VYCQLGPTSGTTIRRREVWLPDEVASQVRARLAVLEREGHAVDHVTFVPDGEPTLDASLGETLRALGRIPAPLAVITNASLLSRADVREALSHAAWVSIKVDAADEATWRRVNRPDSGLRFHEVVAGMKQLAADFAGTLVTETMLVAGLNDDAASVAGVAALISALGPETAYLAVPTRPAAERWVRPPDEPTLARAFAQFEEAGVPAELLVGYPEPAFVETDDVEASLLRITAVHPMRAVEVDDLLARSHATRDRVERLVQDGLLRRVEYEGQTFYVRVLA
jgi:wyosine [tRNA(Phe)-imidazoG37] synthetase (radical SAM superfamily)